MWDAQTLTTKCGCTNLELIREHVAENDADCVQKYLTASTVEHIDCVPGSLAVDVNKYRSVFYTDDTGAPGLCGAGFACLNA